MTAEGKPDRPHRPLRTWLGLILLIALIAVAAVGAGLYTGTLPREALRAALQRSLPVKAEVSGVRVFGEPGVESLRLFDADDPIETPAIAMENLTLDYRLRPEDGRYIDGLSIATLRLHLAQLDAYNTNYDFLLGLLEGPGGTGDPLPFVPKQLDMGLAELEVIQPKASARIGDLHARVTVETLHRIRATLHSDAVPVAWKLGEEAWREPDPGRLELDAAWENGEFNLDGTAQLPEFAELDAEASGAFTETGWKIDATLAPSTLSGAVAGLIPEALVPAPLRFDSVAVAEGRFAARMDAEDLTVDTAQLDATVSGLELGPADAPYLIGSGKVSLAAAGESGIEIRAALEPAEVTGGALDLAPEGMIRVPLSFNEAQFQALSATLRYDDEGWALPEAKAQGQFEELVVGPPASPWYAGGLGLDGTATPGAGTLARMTLTLQEGQAAEVSVARPDGDWQVDMKANGWSRAQVLSATPVSWRDRIANLFPTLEQASATARFDYAATGAELHADAGLGLAGKDGQLSFTMRFPVRGVGPVNFSGTAALAGGNLTFEGGLPPEGGLVVNTNTDGLPLGEWPRLLRPGIMPPGFDAQIRGTLDIEERPEGFELTADVTGTDAAYGEFSLGPLGAVEVKGMGRLSDNATRLAGRDLDIAFADGFRFDASTWSLALDGARLDATVQVGGDLTWLAELFSLPELYGEVEGQGTLTITPQYIRVQPDLQSGLLGYGQFTVPYRQTLTALGELTYAYATRTLTGEAVRLSLGEDNTVTAGTLRISQGEIAFDGLDLRTDLSPLVAMEYLNEGSGTLEATGRLSMAGGAVDAALETTLDAEALVLPATASRLEGVSAQADITYDGTLRGSGSFAVAKTEVGGVGVEGLESDITADGQALVFKGARPTVFGGDTEVSARVGVFEEGLPITLRFYTHGADLARFTEEFEPPSVTLTGTAVGEITLAITGMTLSDLTVDLVVEDGLSVNRDLVIRALMQQYLVGMPGGTLTRDIIEDVVGKADQRPFNRGQIKLGFEGGRITGIASLESDQLNLTVDILADPEAIIEAIRLRQREEAE